ncbi:MAG TPA: DUF4114 domain-containing protein [Lacunisphaera sp.]|nr:DUF4114 domain-containing protein [Lacunisphaera sp.]
MKKLITLLASFSAVAASATTILPGPETPLQTIINNSVTGISIDVNANQVASDAYWSAVVSPAAYMLIEIAGYAGQNTFGIYQKGTPSNKMEVFAGSVSGPSGPVSIIVPSAWNSFGFYMSNPNVGFTWYSDDALNAGGSQDHFAFFQGAYGAQVSGKTFDGDDYIIAIEDLNLGDRDYNDMVVLVQNVSHASDGGATAAFLGLTFAAMAFVRRKLAC